MLGLPCADHKGNKYDSIQKMCDTYHISVSLYCKRIERGWDVQEALEGKHFYIDDNGTKYKTRKDFCAALGISDVTLRNKLKQGYSLDEIAHLDAFKRVTDPNNNKYLNTEEMCAAHGVKVSTYRRRMEKTGNMEYALKSCNYRKKK